MDFADLKEAIESRHEGKATRLQSIPVVEDTNGHIVWEGFVHVFALTGNVNATKAYAWSSPTAGSTKRRYFAVLHSGSITSPQEAVRAVILAEQQATGEG